MRVAKKFRWESAHRLPNHTGECKNLHGHSYLMAVILDGSVGPDGIVIDFRHVKNMVAPLVDAWDHGTLIAEDDTELVELVSRLGSKKFVLPFQTTAENLASFAADYIEEHGKELLLSGSIKRMTIQVHETETCYAEVERTIAN